MAVPTSGPLAGIVVFVPGGVPGDRVTARVIKQKKRFARAEITAVSEPSPGRQEPRCVVQATCGGCPWMTGDRATQDAARLAILEGEVRKTLRWSEAQIEDRVELAPPSGEAYGYRRRVRLAWRRSGPEVTLGYRGRGTHRVVPVTRCEVAVESINESLKLVRDSILDLGEEAGEVTILAGNNGVAWSMLGATGRRGRGGAEGLTISVDEDRLSIDVGGFAQGNEAETSAIARHVARFVGRSDGKLAVELFAGSGTWTAGLLKAGYRVEAYELDGRARPAFEANTRAGEARLHVTDLLETGVPEPPPGRPALVLLDPPRIGAAPLCTWVRAIAAPKALMISCDVATGLRDAAALCEGDGGYEIAQITSYDMFPGTGHQELVIELVRQAPSE